MKYIIKPIISNILLFIETTLLFLILSLSILKITMFNQNYVIKKLNKTNYYETTYNKIKDTMAYISEKSGFSSSIIEDTFTIDDVKNDVIKFVKSLYKGEPVELNIDNLKEKVNNNLEEYILEKDLNTTNEEKKLYLNKITATYKNEIRLMKEYNTFSKSLNKYNKLISPFILLFIIDLAVLVIINKKVFNKKDYNVILLAQVFSLIGSNIIIKLMNFKRLFIYNNEVSNLLKAMIKNISGLSTLIIVILIVVLIIMNRKIEIKK